MASTGLAVRACCAAVCLAQTLPAAAAPIPPQSPWQLDFGNTQCVAARKYGHGLIERIFAIRPSIDGNTYELMLTGPGVGPEYAEEVQGKLDFGSGPFQVWLLQSRTKEKNTLYIYRLTTAEIAPLRGSDKIGLGATGEINIQLALTSTGPLFTMMDKCLEGLRSYWNFDGEKDGRIAKPAEGSIRQIFSEKDFPKEAIDRRQQGRVRFILQVDETGKVAGCNVTKTSGVAVLDSMGCQVILSRAKYKPATDASGKSVRSVVQTPEIVWRLE